MSFRGPWALGLMVSLAGCASILGIDDRVLAPDGGAGPACSSNSQCAVPGASSVCVLPEGRCVDVRSQDCQTVTGEPIPDKAIVIGSLFSTTGSQATTNLPRQNAAALAVEEINRVGGIPTRAGGVPLVMVSCDEAANLLRASNHLAVDLKVPAIVGPNTSQDTIDVTNKVTAAAGTLVMSPTAVASSIGDLSDNSLTWRDIPSDVQRAPLMIQQINDIEGQLKQARSVATIRLGIIWRNDALGLGTFNSLSAMSLNGMLLSNNNNVSNWISAGYDYTADNQNDIVTKYLNFKPDIIAAIGTAEVVTKIMQPIEAGWAAKWNMSPRPYYVLIDSGKTTELLTAVTGNDDLRQRVRGTGVASSPAAAAVFSRFSVNYSAKYGSNPGISGMGPSYDAVYAIAFAMASGHAKPITGANIAEGLRHLSGGPTAAEVGPTHVLSAFNALTADSDIATMGTLGPLDWDPKGDILGSIIEMWCIGKSPVAFGGSGLTYNTKTGLSSGSYTACP